MTTIKRFGWFLGIIAVMGGGGVYLMNASWLAPEPSGHAIVFAHRGVHQLYDRNNLGMQDCTATRIFPPKHSYLENTIASMRESFRLGADAIELDIHLTTDGEFVVFHDWTLDCRTNGEGVTREHSLAELKALDIGYGYTADGGQSFPFRGKGVGLMPTLKEVYDHFPGRQFIINIKSNDPRESVALHRYLDHHGIYQLEHSPHIYGGDRAMREMRKLQPHQFFPNRAQVKQCAKKYMQYGWLGYIPEACRNSVILVPSNHMHVLWGWPNRFLARMRSANTFVMILGVMENNNGIPGVISIDELSSLPAGFDGGIWTDAIEDIGPYVKSVSH